LEGPQRSGGRVEKQPRFRSNSTMGMSISMLSDAVEANHCAMCQMKDDTAAILVLNSFLNKSSTSNSLVPGCYHIHIQTKFFFIAGLRNLVD
jgi:hypothetical protein